MHEKPLTLAAPPQVFLERLDPRIKLPCLLVWAICIVTVPPGRFTLLSIYALILLLLLLSNLKLLGKFARRFGAALPFVVILTCLLPFFSQGRTVWSYGPLEITEQGLWTAQRVATAATLCVAGMALVWASTSESRLLAGLRGLAVPATLVNVLAFMLRYLYVLRPELHRLTDARALRAIGDHGPGRLRSGANIVGALFLRAHDRAERVADAMVSRGFAGQRRDIYHYHWHAHELVAGIVFAGLIVALRWIVQG
ncbi:MAG TPA: cobalt ECF transporter T component CbiQ [Phycisphaerae bacterium]|nr:cobalt ECF transporter T component CbiQ [Phycisphaerae bacterium]